MGYKANITETTKGRFITNINAMPGNRPDGTPTVSLVTDQKAFGLTPSKLIGDSAYGDGGYRKDLKQNGTDVVAPLKETNHKTKIIYPKSMFQYNEEAKTLTCPAGVTTKQSFYDKKKEITVYHFPLAVRTRCPQNKQCTTSADGRRTVGIGKANAELRQAEQYNKTEEFKNDMKLRLVYVDYHWDTSLVLSRIGWRVFFPTQYGVEDI